MCGPARSATNSATFVLELRRPRRPCSPAAAAHRASSRWPSSSTRPSRAWVGKFRRCRQQPVRAISALPPPSRCSRSAECARAVPQIAAAHGVSPGQGRGLPRQMSRRPMQLAEITGTARSAWASTGTPTFFINGNARSALTTGTSLEPLSRRTPAAELERRGTRHDAHQAAEAQRLQELRRAGRAADRAGPHRRRRPQRLRQVEPARGDPLGDGRIAAPSRCAAAAWTT